VIGQTEAAWAAADERLPATDAERAIRDLGAMLLASPPGGRDQSVMVA